MCRIILWFLLQLQMQTPNLNIHLQNSTSLVNNRLLFHWNGNVIILTKVASVMVRKFSKHGNEKVVNLTRFGMVKRIQSVIACVVMICSH